MATGKGGLPGYTGVAVVDEQHQILVEAQAQGVGQEQELLLPGLKAVAALRTDTTGITTDAGDYSEDNRKQLAERGLDAYGPANGHRKRDPRYTGQERHRRKPVPLYPKGAEPATPPLFRS